MSSLSLQAFQIPVHGRPLIWPALILAFGSPALAQLPTYGPFQTRARTNTTAYGLSVSAQIDTNQPPRINNAGQVALPLRSGIWFNGATLNLVGLNPSPYDGIALNNNGVIAWNGVVSTGAPGVYTFNTTTNTGALATNDPGSNYSHNGIAVNDSGVLSYYAATTGYPGIAQYNPASGPPHMLVPSDGTFMSFQVGYHRVLAMNNSGEVVARDTRTSGGGIVRYNPDGSSTVMPGTSALTSTDDRVAINDSGTVAFIRQSFQATVFRSNGASLAVIGGVNSPFDPTFTSILDAAPAIDAAGNVAFIASGPGVQTRILLGDGLSLATVASLGDTVMTDQGLGRITRFYSLDMNDRSDIAFLVDLSSVQFGYSLGTALIVAPAIPTPGAAAMLLAGSMIALTSRRRNPATRKLCRPSH